MFSTFGAAETTMVLPPIFARAGRVSSARISSSRMKSALGSGVLTTVLPASLNADLAKSAQSPSGAMMAIFAGAALKSAEAVLSAAGNSIMKVVPSSGILSTRMLPLSWLTICRQAAKPIPLKPLPLVLKKDAQILSCISSGMPIPSSAMRVVTNPARSEGAVSMVTFFAPASIALRSRLPKARVSCALSAMASGASAAALMLRCLSGVLA